MITRLASCILLVDLTMAELHLTLKGHKTLFGTASEICQYNA
jgi:hypothetical protein